jgi:hypothetical protein
MELLSKHKALEIAIKAHVNFSDMAWNWQTGRSPLYQGASCDSDMASGVVPKSLTGNGITVTCVTRLESLTRAVRGG